MVKKMAIALAVALAAPAAIAASHGSSHGGGGGHNGGGGHAVPRGSGGGYGHGSGAYARHPSAGSGHGYYGSGHGYYGHGYSGHSHYGYGHSHYPYYGYYPSYGYGYYPYYGYGYSPYGWGGVGVGLNFSYNAAPSYVYPPAQPYDDRGNDSGEAYSDRSAGEGYPDRSLRSDDGRESAAEVRLQIQPEDAAVYVDGQLRGPARQLATLHLPAGHHRFEIVRPGMRPAVREVTLGRGESIAVHVDLER